jgi:methionyl-tRNA synthetase
MPTIQDFHDLGLKVAQVTAAERVAGTDKLLKLTLDIGGHTRTTVAGIGNIYQPEQLVGKQLVCVTNLQPALIRGVLSEGMILAVGSANDITLVIPERPVPPGSPVL